MDQKEIHDLIKLINKTDISEFRLKEKDFSIVIRSNDYVKNNGATIVTSAAPQAAVAPQAPAPVANTAAASAAPAKAASEELASVDESNLITFKSPIVGTFYRKSAPDKPSYVKVDDMVSPGSILCVIEAMKLFNEIECEVSGKIVKVLVDDASPVEYDQPLFLIEPA
ncbi:MAG: acetyl-CoA carboxylase biotin carboxyl carrier protein [Chitinophagales bacterium]